MTKLKTQFTQFNFNRIHLADAIPLDTPLAVYLEPSGYCNLKCHFCPQSSTSGDYVKKDILSMEIFKKFLEDLTEFPSPIKMLRICGDGEPTLNKNISSMIEQLPHSTPATAQIAIETVQLVTNGLLLKQRINMEVLNRIDSIIVSIEGLNSDDYLRYTQKNINFDNLLQNLSNFYNEKNGKFKTKLVIKIHDKAVQDKERKERFFSLFKNICDEITIETSVDMWNVFHNPMASDKFRYEGEFKPISNLVCPQIFKALQVYANGDVTPCCLDWKRENIIGNIMELSLLKIWKGEKLRNLQILHLQGRKPSLPICKNCIANDLMDNDDVTTNRKNILERLNIMAPGNS